MLVLQTVYDGSNYWKLGEIVTAAGASSFLYQLTGFPSYGVAGATLAVAGLGSTYLIQVQCYRMATS